MKKHCIVALVTASMALTMPQGTRADTKDVIIGIGVGALLNSMAKGNTKKRSTASKSTRNAAPSLNSQYTRDERIQIQSALANLGYSIGTIDGVLGQNSRRIIGQFQASRGEAQTGQLTRPQFVALVTPGLQGAPVIANRALSRDEVVLLQQSLQRLGYYTSSVDGSKGPRTRAATDAFLISQGQVPGQVSQVETLVAARILSGMPTPPYLQQEASQLSAARQNATQFAQPQMAGGLVQPQQPGANPFGQPQQAAANPFAQPQQAPGGFAQPQQPAGGIFGQPQQAGGFAQPQQPGANPFGQPQQAAANPFAQPQQVPGGFAQPQPAANNPFAPQQATLGTQPQQPAVANPFGQPQQAPAGQMATAPGTAPLFPSGPAPQGQVQPQGQQPLFGAPQQPAPQVPGQQMQPQAPATAAPLFPTQPAPAAPAQGGAIMAGGVAQPQSNLDVFSLQAAAPAAVQPVSGQEAPAAMLMPVGTAAQPSVASGGLDIFTPATN